MNAACLRPCAAALGAGAFLLAAGVIIAQPPAQPPDKPAAKPHAEMSGHVLVLPSDLKWTDAPNSLPAGAKIATLEGDLSMSGPFTVRVKFPAGYKIPAHFHPAVEHATVISGTFHMGMGDKLDTSKGTALPVGGFGVMPTGAHHFAWTDQETVVQIHGIGPWGITYIDPATDPRNRAPEK
jgi:hypothetical protein